ncbi:MAG: cysteine methyltransferase [Pedosphaera sp.]|nr:cysteine methyltransferase [Pedosphaera sp.]
MVRLPIETKDGEFVAYYSELGLAGLEFPKEKGESDRFSSDKSTPSAEVRRWHALTTKALKQVLAGHTPETLPPLDLSSGTEFQQRVWKVLCGIGSGKTMSYMEVAAAIGQSKATRAVGSACGANPIPVLIPCHRVLAANQGLGGFSGGLDWKRKLLAREGVEYIGSSTRQRTLGLAIV